MIKEHVAGFAAEMGLKLTSISVVNGQMVGCLDANLLHISSNGQIVSALMYQHELDDLQVGLPCKRLELRIRAAMAQLPQKNQTNE